MAIIEHSIDVNVPLHTAYNQWTQFEEFPRFMDGVEKVTQVDATTLDWRARIGGVERSWRARIDNQTPDKRIAWVSIDGARNDGAVSFAGLSPTTTRVHLRMDVDPQSPLEEAGTALGVVSRRVKGDLERFRDFIEQRSAETGGWRGTVRDGEPTKASH